MHIVIGAEPQTQFSCHGPSYLLELRMTVPASGLEGQAPNSPLSPSRIPSRGFPGGAVVESLPANTGDTGSSPGLGRSHMPQSD